MNAEVSRSNAFITSQTNKNFQATLFRVRSVARKFSIGGLYISAGGHWVCVGGLDTQKLTKT